MLKRLFLALSVFLCIALASPAFSAEYVPSGLARLAKAPQNAYGTYDGVATFGGIKPSAAQLDQLRALGLAVEGFSHLPFAMLRGPRTAMLDAVARGIAEDVYPNERLKYFSASSNFSIKVNEVHAMGNTGGDLNRQVGVAVVDSGIDGTHPSLTKRIAANYKVIEQSPVPPFYARVDMLYNNSDTTSGHGTHVAGIIAADNTSGIIGVAPGAKLIGYGNGEAIFVFGVLWAFNDIIANKDTFNIRVVNNSWGSSFRMFDPDEPINAATRAMHDAGIVVVFAAGNSTTEMSLNPYSAAPWVISVGNGTINKQRAATSSGGIEFDNSTLVAPLPADAIKYLPFAGDRIGLYHPSVSAPGTNIESTATTGLLVTGTPGGTAEASGTSMASPHVAGVAALMIWRNPNLTPDEVKSALQVTSELMPSTADPTKGEPFHRVGYGWVNARAAVDLVGRMRYNKDSLALMQGRLDDRVLKDRDYSVLRTDYWTYVAPYATVNGVPESRTFGLDVDSKTKAIKALVSYPSLGYVGLNAFNYQLTVKDAAGTVVAVTQPDGSAGMSQFFVDISRGGWAYGKWTVELYGESGAQDEDTLMGRLVTVAVHQLSAQSRVARKFEATGFRSSGVSTYYLQPGSAGALQSVEGCNQQAGAPNGGLATTRPVGQCQSGNMGYATNYGVEVVDGTGTPGSFVSAPLAAPLTVGGTATLRFYLVDPLSPAWMAAGASNPRLVVEVDAVDENGFIITPVAAGETRLCNADFTSCLTGATPTAGTYVMNVLPQTIPIGARLAISIRLTAAVSSASRTVYGGKAGLVDFSDAGLTLTTGTLQ
jgi:serine protease AprX